MAYMSGDKTRPISCGGQQQRLGFSGVYVTHDQEEALAISDRIIAMNKGHIDQDATPEVIFENPKTSFVANFIGSSILVKGKVKDTDHNYLVFETEDKDIIYCNNVNNYPANSIEWVAIKTCHVSLTSQEPSMNRNKWNAKIINKTFLGDHYGLKLVWGSHALNIPQSIREYNLEHSNVYISADPMKCIPLSS